MVVYGESAGDVIDFRSTHYDRHTQITDRPLMWITLHRYVVVENVQNDHFSYSW